MRVISRSRASAGFRNNRTRGLLDDGTDDEIAYRKGRMEARNGNQFPWRGKEQGAENAVEARMN